MLFFGLIAAAYLLDVRQLSAIDSACTVITQTIQIEGYLRAWPTAAAGIFHRTATSRLASSMGESNTGHP